jgi:hypothetical protein
MKRLIGRTDVEDALKKLDKLTDEEARMAVAQNLKATHNVDQRVRGVANDVDLIKRSSSPNLTSVDRRVLRVPFRETNTREHSQMALSTGPIKEP